MDATVINRPVERTPTRQDRNAAMGSGPATPPPRPDRHHRVGHLEPLRARHIALDRTIPRRSRRTPPPLRPRRNPPPPTPAPLPRNSPHHPRPAPTMVRRFGSPHDRGIGSLRSPLKSLNHQTP